MIVGINLKYIFNNSTCYDENKHMITHYMMIMNSEGDLGEGR